MRELEETFEVLAEYRDVTVVKSDPLPLPDFVRERGLIDDYLDRTLPHVPPNPLAAGRDELQSALIKAQEVRELPEYATAVGFTQLLVELRRATKGTHYKW